VKKNKKEIWKHVYHAKDYEVSSHGRIRRAVDARERINSERGRLMSLKPDKRTGYVRVSLRARDGKLLREQLHRLIGREFLGPHRKGAQINHLDGDKTNNHVTNLEWTTPQENVKHAWRVGLCKPHKSHFHGMSKLRKSDIKVIRSADARGVSHLKIAEVFNVTGANISTIARNITWKDL